MNESYGNEMEIQYFSEKSHRSHGKYWVLKDNHVDSKPISDLTKVEHLVNWEGHFVCFGKHKCGFLQLSISGFTVAQ